MWYDMWKQSFKVDIITYIIYSEYAPRLSRQLKVLKYFFSQNSVFGLFENVQKKPQNKVYRNTFRYVTSLKYNKAPNCRQQ